MSGEGDGVLEVPSINTGVETGYGPARFALGSDGEPRILVPCSADATHVDFDATSKLGVSVVKYSCGGRGAVFIDVTCREAALDAVFGELADEVLRRLSAGKSPVEAVTGTIADFKSLLMADPAGQVSLSMIVGLLGEMIVMRRMSGTTGDPVECWQGPWEQRHDFRAGPFAVEVKGSSRSDTSSVLIHGQDQLLPPTGGELVLVLVRMEPAVEGEISVGELFKSLVANGVDARKLRAGLAELGCLDPDDPDWNRHTFGLQSIAAWRVEEGFPRLTARETIAGVIPVGVQDLAYAVDLTHAAPYGMTDADLDVYLKGVTG